MGTFDTISGPKQPFNLLVVFGPLFDFVIASRIGRVRIVRFVVAKGINEFWFRAEKVGHDLTAPHFIFVPLGLPSLFAA